MIAKSSELLLALMGAVPGALWNRFPWPSSCTQALDQSPMATIRWSGVKCIVTVLKKDKSRFSFWPSDGRVWNWWRPEELCLPGCTVPILKCSGGGIKLWGCSSGFVLAHSSPVKGHANASPDYNNLEKCLLLTLWDMVWVYCGGIWLAHITAWLHKYSTKWQDTNSQRNIPKSYEKSVEKSGCCHSNKRDHSTLGSSAILSFSSV